jgi:hypothetical protein
MTGIPLGPLAFLGGLLILGWSCPRRRRGLRATTDGSAVRLSRNHNASQVSIQTGCASRRGR